MTQVNTIEQLIEMSDNGIHDFFIQLNGGCRSSKMIDYNYETEKFDIVNEIDYSEQSLTREQLMDEDCTNIGKAIKLGALYSYE